MGNPVRFVDPDGKTITTDDIQSSVSVLDDIFEGYDAIRNLFDVDENGNFTFNETGLSPAIAQTKRMLNATNTKEDAQSKLGFILDITDMLGNIIKSPINISLSFGDASKFGGGVFNQNNGIFDGVIDNSNGYRVILDNTRLYDVEVYDESLNKMCIISSLGERFCHEMLGHGGSYIFNLNGTFDSNAIRYSNAYHSIRGDGYRRTGKDHSNIFLSNPNYANDPYDWLNAVNQRPNLKRPMYRNEVAAFLSAQRNN